MTLPNSRSCRLASLGGALVVVLLLAAACGREAPATPPTVDPGGPETSLTVNSSPAGASIIIDGEDTGQITPHTFEGLQPGAHTLALDLPGYLVSPAVLDLILTESRPVDVPVDAFTTRSLRMVMLEGFANIDCGPCPQLTENLVNLTAMPDYGADRVAYVEYAVFWPNFQDPFYQFNSTEANERIQAYAVPLAPTLVVDGVGQESAVDFEAMRGAVDAALSRDPGVLVDVAADFGANDVPVTVTVTALRDVDLTGYSLYVALYQNSLTLEPSPGTNGQTEFHHIFRDREDDLPALGDLPAGAASVLQVDVLQGDWGAGATTVYAFIQNDADKSILQAGSTALTAHAEARLFVGAGSGHTAQEGNLP